MALKFQVARDVLREVMSAVVIVSCAVSFITYLFQSKALRAYGEMYYVICQKLFAVVSR